jgi:hypothetical protein
MKLSVKIQFKWEWTPNKQTKLRGLSPRANYTDRANRRLSAKLLSTFADGERHVANVTNPSGRTLDFLDRRMDTLK